MLKEFKEFAMRGNVMDMAIGIIIGGAFGKIVSSLVKDVIMPPIGYFTSGVDFTKLSMVIGETTAEDGTVTQVNLNYGNFVQTIIDFIIIAFSIFMIVKIMNSAKKKEEEAPAAPPEPSAEEKLLGEIRDLLASK